MHTRAHHLTHLCTPFRVERRTDRVMDHYLRMQTTAAGTGVPSPRSGGGSIYGPTSLNGMRPVRRPLTRDLYGVSSVSPRVRHSPLGELMSLARSIVCLGLSADMGPAGTSSEWVGHYAAPEPGENPRRAPIPPTRHEKVEHVWYRPYRRRPPYQSRWGGGAAAGMMGGVVGYGPGVPEPIGPPGAQVVADVEADAAALGSQSARPSEATSTPSLPQIPGAQSAR